MLSTLPAFIIPIITCLGIYLGGVWIFASTLYIFIFHPILDQAIGNYVLQKTSSSRSNSLLQLTLPVMVLTFGISFYKILTFSGFEFWAGCFALGLAGGAFGITASHELIHRSSSWLHFQGIALLSIVFYSHFSIEHVHGHHRWVSTPRDPATSRLGEGVYHFWFRSLSGGLISAIRIAKEKNQNLSLMVGFFLQGLWLSTVYGVGGFAGVQIYLSSSFVAILLLETINYVEHYGLSRKELTPGRYEPVRPVHSWDSHRYLTNASLFNLGLHSHHPYKANVPFEQLRAMPEAPTLPFGYSFMFILALVPPAWRQVMDKRVRALSSASIDIKEDGFSESA